MKFQCHSMGLKVLVQFDAIFMGKVHGIVMEFDIIFDQNSDGNQSMMAFYYAGILIKYTYPVKNGVRIFSCLFDGRLVEHELKSDGNPIIFLANAMKIP